ncbi:coiled-coil-helix-coiled-coil-helix domain-containing protein 1 [Morone saxatilis]|uniref:coiled-coil-helix-coiled-coil-helix domain-containing protein 1 n=1 Tax=Morone saxatilis TaxID=34816 RepID=UPI0015E20E4A|nr:coiled-coil-helix-coiled-coil-helix domain-containing protein 1 [Morone saxatilis]
MAAQGGVAFQEKVSRLLSKHNGRPVLKPNRTLALRDSVANRKQKKGGSCWKQHTFADEPCSYEMKSFFTCVEKAQAAMKNKTDQTSMKGERLPPKVAITLLKRYPNLHTEI